MIISPLQMVTNNIIIVDLLQRPLAIIELFLPLLGLDHYDEE